MQQIICPLLYFGNVKMNLVSMATHNAILKNGGVPTKSTICQLLFDLKYIIWYQIRHIPFSYDQQCKFSNYANNLICIFMNINKKSKCLKSCKESSINLLILVPTYQCFMLL